MSSKVKDDGSRVSERRNDSKNDKECAAWWDNEKNVVCANFEHTQVESEVSFIPERKALILAHGDCQGALYRVTCLPSGMVS